MNAPQPPAPSEDRPLPPSIGVDLPRDAEDEPAFYRPPARSGVPRDGMLVALLATIVLILAGIGTASYFMLTAPPSSTTFGGQARQPTADTAPRQPGIPDLPPPPVVEEVGYLDIPREAARQINESIPFVPGPVPAATPLRLTLPLLQQKRAIDCLAAAQWYEAGDDWVGQRSVAQVVVNRMRHPSFPNTICGVVFQGMERHTGCQFSFTCDGSMARRTPSPTAWQRAVSAATAALAGSVFREVGWATHYHTDWVVPNWSRSVDKIARVRTHLFFRWRGTAGRPIAFYRSHPGIEPEIPLMRPLSPAHAGTLSPDGTALPTPADGAAGDGSTTPAPPVTANLRGNDLSSANGAAGVYVIDVKPDAFSGSLAVMALDICRERRGACTVIGFVGAPGRVTGGENGRVRWPDKTPDFYYFSDKSRAREIVYWNCTTYRRPSSDQCLPANYEPMG